MSAVGDGDGRGHTLRQRGVLCPTDGVGQLHRPVDALLGERVVERLDFPGGRYDEHMAGGRAQRPIFRVRLYGDGELSGQPGQRRDKPFGGIDGSCPIAKPGQKRGVFYRARHDRPFRRIDRVGCLGPRGVAPRFGGGRPDRAI